MKLGTKPWKLTVKCRGTVVHRWLQNKGAGVGIQQEKKYLYLLESKKKQYNQK